MMMGSPAQWDLATIFGRREHADHRVGSFGETLEYMGVPVRRFGVPGAPGAPGARSGLRTGVYCSRHRQNFRLALDALTAPKKSSIENIIKPAAGVVRVLPGN